MSPRRVTLTNPSQTSKREGIQIEKGGVRRQKGTLIKKEAHQGKVPQPEHVGVRCYSKLKERKKSHNEKKEIRFLRGY